MGWPRPALSLHRSSRVRPRKPPGDWNRSHRNARWPRRPRKVTGLSSSPLHQKNWRCRRLGSRQGQPAFSGLWVHSSKLPGVNPSKIAIPKRTSVVEAEATVHKTGIASARQPPPYPRMNTLPAHWRPLLAALVAFIFIGIVAFTANKVLEARAAALRAAAANEQLSAKALARVLSMTFDALAAHVDTTAALVESSTQLLSGGGTNESFERARAPLMYPAFKSFLLVDGKGRVLL